MGFGQIGVVPVDHHLPQHRLLSSPFGNHHYFQKGEDCEIMKPLLGGGERNQATLIVGV